MKCSNCGYEQENDFSFCPSCGSSIEQQASANMQPPKTTSSAKTEANGVTYTGRVDSSRMQPKPQIDISTLDPRQRANALFRDGSFLGALILMSVNVILDIFSIIPFGISIIRILFVIFGWIAYAAANKYRIEVKHVRWISGVCAANKIVSYVKTGIILAAGIVCMVVLSAAGTSSLIWDALSKVPEAAQYRQYIEPLATASGAVVLVGCIIAAAFTFVFAFLGLRSFHFFVRSVYRSIESGSYQIEKRRNCTAWLIVFAVFSGLGVFGGLINIIGTLQSIAGCVAYILLSIAVNRYYREF